MQGVVSPMTIRGTRKVVFVCDECEALWLGGEEDKGFFDMRTFLMEAKQENGWDDLEDCVATHSMLLPAYRGDHGTNEKAGAL